MMANSIGSTVDPRALRHRDRPPLIRCIHDLSTECSDRFLEATSDALRSTCAALLDVVDIDCCMKISELARNLERTLADDVICDIIFGEQRAFTGAARKHTSAL